MKRNNLFYFLVNINLLVLLAFIRYICGFNKWIFSAIYLALFLLLVIIYVIRYQRKEVKVHGFPYILLLISFLVSYFVSMVYPTSIGAAMPFLFIVLGFAFELFRTTNNFDNFALLSFSVVFPSAIFIISGIKFLFIDNPLTEWEDILMNVKSFLFIIAVIALVIYSIYSCLFYVKGHREEEEVNE